jgi:hypothetical protein
MNTIVGLCMTGLTLITEESLNSIPGLWQWNDARERIDIETGIAFWGDKSAQGNNLIQTLPVNQPQLEKGLWVKSNIVSSCLFSTRRDYNFLHNGSKFGIYAIQKPSWSIDTPALAVNVLQTASAGQSVGLQGVLQSNAVNGIAGVILRGGAASSSRVITNVLNPTHPNYTASGTINIYSVVNFGQTLGVRVSYNGKITNLPPFFPTLAEYPTTPHTGFKVAVGFTGITSRIGILLVYNWTGFSDEQVQSFDQRVMTFLEKEKTIFQNLDT